MIIYAFYHYLFSFVILFGLIRPYMPCFASQVQKEDKYQNLLFLASSTQVELWKKKKKTRDQKGKSLGMMKKWSHEAHPLKLWETMKIWLVFEETEKGAKEGC